MAVVPLTLTISLGLVFLFVFLFWREHSCRRFSSAESESLLPLAEEKPTVVPARSGADHCGCRDGRQAPCAGCLKPGQVASSPPVSLQP